MLLFKNIYFSFLLVVCITINAATTLYSMQAFSPDAYTDSPILSDHKDLQKNENPSKTDEINNIDDLVLSHTPAKDYEEWVNNVSQGIRYCVIGSVTLMAFYCYVSH